MLKALQKINPFPDGHEEKKLKIRRFFIRHAKKNQRYENFPLICTLIFLILPPLKKIGSNKKLNITSGNYSESFKLGDCKI